MELCWCIILLWLTPPEQCSHQEHCSQCWRWENRVQNIMSSGKQKPWFWSGFSEAQRQWSVPSPAPRHNTRTTWLTQNQSSVSLICFTALFSWVEKSVRNHHEYLGKNFLKTKYLAIKAYTNFIWFVLMPIGIYSIITSPQCLWFPELIHIFKNKKMFKILKSNKSYEEQIH